MNRFFVPQTHIRDGIAYIDAEDAKHILRVLRLRRGDALLVCDGAGKEYTGRIETEEKDGLQVTLSQARACENELPFMVTVMQALPKAGKMEWIVQKCTELGACAFVPIASVRSVVQLTEKEFEKKRVRYEKVAREAAMQSQRGILPQVETLRRLDQIDFAPYDCVLLLYEEERERSLKRALHAMDGRPSRVALIVGPEGGIAPEEAAYAVSRGGVSVSLGKRILRTETAAMAALSMLQYALCDE